MLAGGNKLADAAALKPVTMTGSGMPEHVHGAGGGEGVVSSSGRETLGQHEETSNPHQPNGVAKTGDDDASDMGKFARQAATERVVTAPIPPGAQHSVPGTATFSSAARTGAGLPS